MVIIQEEYLLRNNTATTSDWIGQVKGHVIYSYDLGTQFPEGPDDQNLIHKAVQKYKGRFEEAWEELSEK